MAKSEAKAANYQPAASDIEISMNSVVYDSLYSSTARSWSRILRLHYIGIMEVAGHIPLHYFSLLL